MANADADGFTPVVGKNSYKIQIGQEKETIGLEAFLRVSSKETQGQNIGPKKSGAPKDLGRENRNKSGKQNQSKLMDTEVTVNLRPSGKRELAQSPEAVPATGKKGRMEGDKGPSPPARMEVEERADGAVGEDESPQNLIVYMTGKTQNLTHVRPETVKREITDQFSTVEKIEKTGKSLRVFCRTKLQKTKMLHGGIIAGIPVACSEPRPKRVANQERVRKTRVVVTGVPLDITSEELVEAGGAESAMRIRKRREGALVDTMAVILTYGAGMTVPVVVRVDYLTFKVRDYVPLPMRCLNCQGYGHMQAYCRSIAPVCPVCAQGHGFAECPNKDAPKCANCGEGHSAGYKKCERYCEVKNTLQISVTKKVSYRDALVMCRGTTAEQSRNANEGQNPRQAGENTAASQVEQSSRVSHNADEAQQLRQAGEMPALSQAEQSSGSQNADEARHPRQTGSIPNRSQNASSILKNRTQKPVLRNPTQGPKIRARSDTKWHPKTRAGQTKAKFLWYRDLRQFSDPAPLAPPVLQQRPERQRQPRPSCS